MDINTALIGTFVLLFRTPKPYNPAYDWVAPGGVCGQDLTGRLPPVKDRSGRRSGADFSGDLQTPERCAPTSKIISLPVARSGYFVGSINFPIY
jgi:hypothetical protein